jgi:phosphopantetheinyl transferase
MVRTVATQIRAIPVPPPAEVALATACLSSSERRLMENYRHQRRRSEFVAGRLALKQALLETEGSAVRIGSAAPLPDSFLRAAQQMQVLPDDGGRPMLWVENAAVPTQVSIAHAAGWAAAACSHLPIGVDIVDVAATTSVPDDSPWLDGVGPAWRVQLRALLWGVRECLLKAGLTSGKNLWSLNSVQALPTCPASEIIARWPQPSRLASLEIQVENKLVAGAFVALSRSALLVMILETASHDKLDVH